MAFLTAVSYTHLDVYKRQVLSLLKYTGRELGITLILVTHDLHVAEQADRIITVSYTHLSWASGTTAENCSVLYSKSNAVAKIDTASGEIVEADYCLLYTSRCV